MLFRPYKRIKKLERKLASIEHAVKRARQNGDLNYLRGY